VVALELMNEAKATLLTIALASTNFVEGEEPATRARIVDTLRFFFEADESDSEIDIALHQLMDWGLVTRSGDIYRITEEGGCFLLKCQQGARSLREHLEAVQQLFSARLTESSNNSLKSDAESRAP
jgi:hypothetical protein